MSRTTSKTWIAAATLTVGILFAPAVALATDNDTTNHRHSRTWGFRTHSQLPADWKDAIAEAALAWTNTGARLNFTYNGDISSNDPGTTSHIFWRGTIPSSWQSSCPPATTLACTRYRFETNSYVHLSDADTVFDQNDSMGASSTNCAFHIGIDVQTLALHEFGHWGRLTHSGDSGAAMYASYNDCQRTPATHDDNSMTANYQGHV